MGLGRFGSGTVPKAPLLSFRNRTCEASPLLWWVRLFSFLAMADAVASICGLPLPLPVKPVPPIKWIIDQPPRSGARSLGSLPDRLYFPSSRPYPPCPPPELTSSPTTTPATIASPVDLCPSQVPLLASPPPMETCVSLSDRPPDLLNREF